MELEAADRFTRLAEGLRDVDADPTVVGLAERAALDERRHHTLCGELATSLGASSVPTEGPASAPVTLDRTRPRERLLAEVVAMSCITETLSTALLVEMRACARHESVRAVAHEVLRDEVDHARLGWAHLACEAGRGDVRWLAPRLPSMLAATVSQELFAEPAGDDELAQAVAGLGSLTRTRRREVFVGTMEGVVFPGLERFGVDARPAREWLAARSGSAQRLRPQLLREVGEGLGQR